MRNRFEIARDARAALAAERRTLADGGDVDIDRLVIDVPDGASTDGLGAAIARGLAAQLDTIAEQSQIARDDRE